MTAATGSAPSGWRRLRSSFPRAQSFRSWTIDANDGIIGTSGILEGFAGAGASHSVLVTAASAATIAGALGLGGATWAEAAAEREAQLELAEEERAQLAADPAAEIDELAAYYERKGLSPDLAREVAEQLTAHDALAAQLETEHGITEVMYRPSLSWRECRPGSPSRSAPLSRWRSPSSSRRRSSRGRSSSRRSSP